MHGPCSASPRMEGKAKELLQYKDRTSSSPLYIGLHYLMTCRSHSPSPLSFLQTLTDTLFGNLSFLMHIDLLLFPFMMNASLLR